MIAPIIGGILCIIIIVALFFNWRLACLLVALLAGLTFAGYIVYDRQRAFEREEVISIAQCVLQDGKGDLNKNYSARVSFCDPDDIIDTPKLQALVARQVKAELWKK